MKFVVYYSAGSVCVARLDLGVKKRNQTPLLPVLFPLSAPKQIEGKESKIEGKESKLRGRGRGRVREQAGARLEQARVCGEGGDASPAA